MKVTIGPYKDWVGPYQLADLLKYLGVPEEMRDKIGEYLSNTSLYKLCEYIDKKKKRKVKIQVDDYDTWDCDHTMSLLILPLLKKYRENLTGHPRTDDEDAPEYLSSKNAPAEGEYDFDVNAEIRYKWILDEIIWSFEALLDGDEQFWSGTPGNFEFDNDGYDEYNKRIDNGLRLFGKYYRGFWT